MPPTQQSGSTIGASKCHLVIETGGELAGQFAESLSYPLVVVAELAFS